MAGRPGRTPLRGVWYRHVRAGGNPLRVAPADSRARWQRTSVVGAIYLADSSDTAWGEFYRAAAERRYPPDEMLPRDVWQLELALEEVVDLSDEAALRPLGLPRPIPDRAQWPAFQTVGERLAAAGAQAILYESAARPGHLCLCVFAPALSHVTPLGPPRRIERPPAPPRGMRT